MRRVIPRDSVQEFIMHVLIILYNGQSSWSSLILTMFIFYHYLDVRLMKRSSHRVLFHTEYSLLVTARCRPEALEVLLIKDVRVASSYEIETKEQRLPIILLIFCDFKEFMISYPEGLRPVMACVWLWLENSQIQFF